MGVPNETVIQLPRLSGSQVSATAAHLLLPESLQNNQFNPNDTEMVNAFSAGKPTALQGQGRIPISKWSPMQRERSWLTLFG